MMSFGPESTNPRHRRSYAHALLQHARDEQATPELLSAAEAAVSVALMTEKGRRSGLDHALAKIVLAQSAEQ